MKTVHCIKLNSEAEALERAPWPGEIGQQILAQVSKPAWNEWLGQQTILINENNYSPINPEHKAILQEAMKQWFFGEQA